MCYHLVYYDEEREAASPPPEATLGLKPSALRETVDTKLNNLSTSVTTSRGASARYSDYATPSRRSTASRWSCSSRYLFLLQSADGSEQEHVLSVSHVCAQWRALAFSVPRLWTHIPLWQCDLARLFLTCSKDLLVTSESGIEGSKTLLQALLPLERLRSLRVALSNPFDTEVLLEFLTQPAPHLENLELLTKDAEGALSPLDHGVTRTPTPFLANTVPKLRSVVMENISFRFTSGIFTNLTQLKVFDVDAHVPPVDLFLNVLDLCPHLEILKYCSKRWSSARTAAWARSRPVVLSRLLELALEYQPSAWVAFVLGSVDLTATHARVQLTQHNEANFSFLPADMARVPSLAALIHVLEADREPMASIVLRNIRWISNSIACRAAFTKLDVSALEDLIIEETSNKSYHILQRDNWSFCLGQSNNLRYLHLVDLSSREAQKILSVLFTSASGQEGGDVIFPQLATLQLTGLSYDVQTEQALVACLQRASDARVPLILVKLSGMELWLSPSLDQLNGIYAKPTVGLDL
ncbi:uncharacterized protein C8Q71DRAFT_853145 [Rhodofomes roseus]|uniref:F-box domain-containing protein n=1 Tax=Rhodofomes roseus TaxID=34475 RepID=A0ABQ8KW67_9APHY|nr:uncharacterized protein C8Q71DRAFT_853145 [Rhodofomes roseus]KAH9842603.1 hypothetical protein C8Q71DRAFT_853145 [Rhodofomes roseus]